MRRSAALQSPVLLPDRMSLLGLRISQVVAWQLIVVVAAVALITRSPERWVLGAVAAVGACLTVPRWRHRWAYEWLLTAWRFHRSRRIEFAAASPPSWPSAALAAIDITPARVRSGPMAGVAHDGKGFAVIVSVSPEPGAPNAEVPVTGLAKLLDLQDPMVGVVQIVLHADLADGQGTSGPAAAYRGLGYHRVPRSQSTWIVLRHDPVRSGLAAGAGRDLHASLLRALIGRGTRVADLLVDLGLRGHLADADAARKLLTGDLLAPQPVAVSGPPSPQWRSWHSGTRQHVTFWLRRWPTGGLGVLQQALGNVPALSMTTAVVLTHADHGRIGASVTIRVAAEPGTNVKALARAVSGAAASCGARLVPLNGDHATGVLATLPLGREPEPAGRWLSRHGVGSLAGPLATVIPVTAGGVVLGVDAADDPVAIPFFRADGATRAAVIGDAALPKLLAIRALGAGALLQVVTARPGSWLKLRSSAQLPPEQMTVVRPGTAPPPDGTRAAPRMIIDDTGSPATVASHPWQAAVTAPDPDTAVSMGGLDAVVLQRPAPDVVAATAATLELPASAEESLRAVRDGVVAVAVPGAARFAMLAPHPSEREILRESLRAG